MKSKFVRYMTFVLLCVIIIEWLLLPLPLVYGQSTGLRKYTVADETTKIKSSEYTYYPFSIDPSWTSVEFTGDYEEDKDRDVIVTLYDASTCNAPVSSEDFDKDTCKAVFSETDSSGFIDKKIPPGRYVLTVESADEDQRVKATVHFDVKYDLSPTTSASIPTPNTTPIPTPNTTPIQAEKGTIEYYCIQYHNYIQKSEEDCHNMFHGNTPTSTAAFFIGCTLGKIIPAVVPALRPAEAALLFLKC